MPPFRRTNFWIPRTLCVIALVLVTVPSCATKQSDSEHRATPREEGAAHPRAKNPLAKARTANTSATRSPVTAPNMTVRGAQSGGARKDGGSQSESAGSAELTEPHRDHSSPFRQPSATSPTRPSGEEGPFAPQALELPAIDLERIGSAGIRKLEGKHITLFTDLPSAPDIDELPSVFDLAIRPWCAYFGVDPESVENWKIRGFLMERRERFEALELLPANLPAFRNGYSIRNQLWLHEQKSAYYRRHLFLHEGTHAFMQSVLHGMGPPWYAEGMAELMSTHRWQNGKLQLRYFPKSREDVPYWGRIKIVRTAFETGHALTLEQIFNYDETAHLQVEPYGWCWATAAFLDGHPQFRERFRRLPRHVTEPAREFNQVVFQLYQTDYRQLIEQWQLFVTHLDYGYDLAREAIVYVPMRRDTEQEIVLDIQADRGWQSTGIIVSSEATYVIEATGRYQLATKPIVWWCEPNGVTIRYYGGHPLGMLLAGVSDQDRPIEGITPLAHPEPIGPRRELRFGTGGTLFLRINDSPAELADNAGKLRVTIRRTGR